MNDFSWADFNKDFMKSVLRYGKNKKKYASIDLDNIDDGYLASLMYEVCPDPDRDFIETYRQIIDDELLPKYKSVLKQMIKALKLDGSGFNSNQAKLRSRKMSATVAGVYITALHNISGMDEELSENSFFSNTIPVDIVKETIPKVNLYDFQKEAVKKLHNHFVTKDNQRGLLVMPTGSGKSLTAIYFLIKDMIASGYQIFWIAHRHMLLNQAADGFYRLAGLSKIKDPAIKKYRISCVSGEHLSVSQVDKGDEIVIASNMSVCRNKKHLTRIFGNKVMIVIDEAHHTPAASYSDVINYLMKNRRDVKLLGLTATPIRATEKGTASLMNIYDETIVYDISMAELIARGILAKPDFERVETNESFEADIDEKEKRYIRIYEELPPTLVQRIADSKPRNALILDQFLKNKERYGKTLIFALNQVHCRTLAEELKNAGISCGVVYSGKDDNQQTIQDFKDNKFQVLVNVNIMTEGTDVPDIQTIFLTRPTQSEGFLMQMIGRGMRGVNAGGTEEVYIVDFHDKWDVFNKWLNPEWVISAEDPEITTVTHKINSVIEIEWKAIQDVYKNMSATAVEYGVYLSVPYGWFSLYDSDGVPIRLLVFEDQVRGYAELFRHDEEWVNDDDINAEDSARVLDAYFGYICNRPYAHDIELLLTHLRDNKEVPPLHPIAERDQINPRSIVSRAEAEGRDLFELSEEVYESSQLAKDLFDTLEDYQTACSQAKIYKNNPRKLGAAVEILDEEKLEFDLTPTYDLKQLLTEVVNEMYGGELPGLDKIKIMWTDEYYKSYFGMHYADHRIYINKILNSVNVPREVVKFVIYHELIHEDIPNHGKEFKLREGLYPNIEDHDHFLDTMFRKYDIRLRYDD
ncbi:Superfamily II DNA or RNA helicase [Lachnospiraceae bacterium XBB2008]|nr:Superfamily II DNA or RNA helicase [Lachnospiraceae bacterium XBB2008]